MWSASIHSIHVDSWHISLPSSLADLGTSTKHWLIRSLHVPKSRQQPMMQRCWSRWSKRPCSLRETKWNEVMDTPSERSLAAMPRIVCGFNSFACRRHNLVLHGSAPFTVAHPGTLHRTSLESALSQLGQLRVVAMRQFHLHPMPPVPNEEISTADGLLRANGADQAGPGNVRDSWEDAGHLRSIWMYLVWNSHSLAIQNTPELPLRSRFIPFLHVWRQMLQQLQQPYKWGAMWIIYFPCSCHKWSEERSRKVINFNRHSKRRRISNQSNS